jgi:hypothetical protein
MANTKHKSKYQKPKDLEKSQKPKPRKDLKDYTMDDKDEALNPKSTKEKQSNVLRKTDKEVVDTGDLNIKYNADDRLYKDLEDGEYDPKTAAKRMEKREKAAEKSMKDHLENLTTEQRERLVRQYIRKRIDKILSEQTTPEEEPTPEDAATTPDATATPAPATPPAPDAAATPPAETPAPAEAPAPEANPQEETDRVIRQVTDEMQKEGGVGIVKMIARILNPILQSREIEDQENLLRMIRTYSVKKLSTLGQENKNPE